MQKLSMFSLSIRSITFQKRDAIVMYNWNWPISPVLGDLVGPLDVKIMVFLVRKRRRYIISSKDPHAGRNFFATN